MTTPVKLTRSLIKQVLVKNILSGSIETGYAYWLPQWISMPFDHLLFDLCKPIRELMEKTELSTIPIENSREKLLERIDELAEDLYRIHQLEN